jgi:hypothetical protein
VISFRHTLGFTILVLTVGTLGPACGQITGDAPIDGTGGLAGGGSGGGDIDDGQLPGGSGGIPGSGGSLGAGGSAGECFFQHDEVQPCPDYCTALLQARCKEESPYELSTVQNCEPQASGFHNTRVTWSSETGGLICDYSDNAWVAVHQYSHTAAFCDGTSTDIRAGEALTDCPTPNLEVCSGFDPPTGGETGEGGAPPEIPRAECYSDFDGGCGPCCPDTPPDCTGKPEGYPGYACTKGFCVCSCGGGEWLGEWMCAC